MIQDRIGVKWEWRGRRWGGVGCSRQNGEWRGPGFEDSFSTVADKRPMCITAMGGDLTGEFDSHLG